MGIYCHFCWQNRGFHATDDDVLIISDSMPSTTNPDLIVHAKLADQVLKLIIMDHCLAITQSKQIIPSGFCPSRRLKAAADEKTVARGFSQVALPTSWLLPPGFIWVPTIRG